MKTFSLMGLVIFTLMITIQCYSQTEKSAVISADKMNVFYQGVENPISVAVPGITSDKIRVSINNGSITGSNGQYIVNISRGDEAIIDVLTEIKPGENQKIGSYLFRVLRVPVPSVTLGNFTPGNQCINLSKNELIKNAELKISWNLPLELKFEVTSFSFVYIKDGDVLSIRNTGNKFSNEIQKIINTMKAGDKIFIEDINVLGPDGTRTLPEIHIQLTDKE
jgi:gliding motility-associated protein GldM